MEKKHSSEKLTLLKQFTTLRMCVNRNSLFGNFLRLKINIEEELDYANKGIVSILMSKMAAFSMEGFPNCVNHNENLVCQWQSPFIGLGVQNTAIQSLSLLVIYSNSLKAFIVVQIGKWIFSWTEYVIIIYRGRPFHWSIHTTFRYA